MKNVKGSKDKARGNKRDRDVTLDYLSSYKLYAIQLIESILTHFTFESN